MYLIMKEPDWLRGSDAPETYKRQVIDAQKSIVLTDEAGKTFQEKINELWVGIDQMKTAIENKGKIKLPEAVIDNVSGVVSATGKAVAVNWIPITVVVAGLAIFLYTRKK